MADWIDDDKIHVEHFELKCKSLELSVATQNGSRHYSDPVVAQLWEFYKRGVQKENNKWQEDCY